MSVLVSVDSENLIKDHVARLNGMSPRILSREIFYRDCGWYVLATSFDAVIDGRWSKKFGGRYNPADAFPAMYLASSRLMSQLEVAHHARLDPSALLLATPSARLSVPIRVTAHVLDLTDPNVLSQLDVNYTDLVCETDQWQAAQRTGDLMAPQCIGLAVARVSKFEGILFPSAVPDSILSPLRLDGILHVAPYNLMLIMDDTTTTSPRGTYSLLEPVGAPLGP